MIFYENFIFDRIGKNRIGNIPPVSIKIDN